MTSGMHFIKVMAVLVEDFDEDQDLTLHPPKTYKRWVMIPFENISMVQEGIDRKTTDIILYDGEVVNCNSKYEDVFDEWEKWYTDEKNKFISFTRTN